MSQASANEQYLLELINIDRAKNGAQPLAFDGNLNTAAENHSAWMIATDTFSHTGAGGSDPGARMAAAGYAFTGSWAWAENIAWVSTRAPDGLQDEVQLLHTNLMNSPGHRANLLNDTYREIGVGLETGQYGSYDSAFVTENFARTGTSSFLTGVAFGDKDADKSYDIGEGLGNVTVSARNDATGAVKSATTAPAGGYDMELAAGNYTVTFSGAGIASTTQHATIGSKNVKLDLLAPSGGTTPEPTPTPTPTPTPAPQPGSISGTSASNTLYGTSGNDTILGLGGNDTLYGRAGADRLDGGTGDDWLYGGSGTDVLTGGSGRDTFVFNSAFAGAPDKIVDFLPADDTIRLENAVFTGLPAGNLAAAAFYVGSAAHDASDRVIYNPETGALSFDADGAGGAAAQQFAQLAGHLPLSAADFVII